MKTKERRYQLSGILYHANYIDLCLRNTQCACIQILCFYIHLLLNIFPDFNWVCKLDTWLYYKANKYARLSRILVREIEHRMYQIKKRFGQ